MVQSTKTIDPVTFYFVAANPVELNLLIECGARNVLTSFAYIPKFTGGLQKHRKHFDKILVDSGAFTTATTGTKVSIDEYVKWCIDNKDDYDHVAQLDVVGDPEKTRENYKYMVDNGVDWVMPVLAGEWDAGLQQIKDYIQTDYIALGGAYALDSYTDESIIIRNLPRKYKYHGFAKGNVDYMKYRWLHSIDSSYWTFGDRASTGSSWIKGSSWSTPLRNSGKNNRLEVSYVHSLCREDFRACNINIKDVHEGKYKALMKYNIAGYYRPLFRSIGKDMFDKNFKF